MLNVKDLTSLETFCFQDEDLYDLEDRNDIKATPNEHYESVVIMEQPVSLGPFDDIECASKAMFQYSALNNFTFKIKTKKFDVKKKCVGIWLQCDRQGKPAAFTADRSRQSSSKRCGCKVDIRIQKSNDGFLIHCKNLVHNHPCEERDVVGHTANRTLSKKHLDFLREQIGVFSVIVLW
ncbi:hypothetical protein [Parasitella parasitica]|uniref:FAR1 domain-containing protein n=1 Tax=Parasitella parasitica TaxID=35722 RepID=A0A0B7NCB9_9FUNG|nr:hypothetical protein [Parasitella parasitica]